jgi:hypothetical protein
MGRKISVLLGTQNCKRAAHASGPETSPVVSVA